MPTALIFMGSHDVSTTSVMGIRDTMEMENPIEVCMH